MIKHLTLIAAGTILLVSSQLALAAGKIDGPSSDERFDRAVAHINAERYNAAVREFRRIVSDEPKNADAWNWLGFAARNVGKFDLSWDAYDRALALEPDHLGAMNYLGHLYIAKADMASAAEMLDRLQDTCGQCEEAESLAEAIAESR